MNKSNSCNDCGGSGCFVCQPKNFNGFFQNKSVSNKKTTEIQKKKKVIKSDQFNNRSNEVTVPVKIQGTREIVENGDDEFSLNFSDFIQKVPNQSGEEIKPPFNLDEYINLRATDEEKKILEDDYEYACDIEGTTDPIKIYDERAREIRGRLAQKHLIEMSKYKCKDCGGLDQCYCDDPIMKMPMPIDRDLKDWE